MRTNFTSQKAVITGGSSGIGRSIAKKFSGAGIQTAVVDINLPEEREENFYSVDLTKAEEINVFADDYLQRRGTPDILVCCAGRGIHEKLTEGDPDVWEEIFRVNVFSAFRMVRAFVPEMQKKKKGDIVFISSVSSNHAHTYGGIYTATKAAIDQLAETLRLEVLPEVRVTIVRPGVVDTNFFKNMISGTHTPEDIGWGSLDPDQIAESVLYAVSQPEGTMINEIVVRPSAQIM